ncbi:MAG: response regulator [Spirochaetaceae bacterium]|jgi:CheY-like chemotaxis protein|nr:response regulator [Spirochaetaceae bacterium]
MNSRKKILIVDDEQLNLEFFDVMLTKLGFIVEKAEDGVEALEKVRHFAPDVIMLDNIMPRMTGWEVTKTLKANPDYRDIPIIMFSALGDVKDKVEGFELGVDDYITKPFNFSEVLARVQAVLRNRELYRQILVRESRLTLAETFRSAVKADIAGFLKIIGELDAAVDAPGGNLAALVREKTSQARKTAGEMEKRIDQIAAEWDDLKKDEIGLKALEKSFRKAPQPDRDMDAGDDDAED